MLLWLSFSGFYTDRLHTDASAFTQLYCALHMIARVRGVNRVEIKKKGGALLNEHQFQNVFFSFSEVA